MDNRDRALLFTRYVGMELKGRITTRGFTAKTVAERTHRSASALNRWLNGRVELPLAVLCETCEVIGVEPAHVIDAAYGRLVVEFGGPGAKSGPDVPAFADTEGQPLAAKKGTRRADAPSAE